MRAGAAQSAGRGCNVAWMAPLPPWFKVACWVMTALLGLSVALQYNDPDPVVWMAIYGAGAILSALLPARRVLALPALVVGLVAAAWAIYLIQSVWGDIAVSDLTSKMSEKGGAVEVGREAGGLSIEAVWLLFAASFRQRRS